MGEDTYRDRKPLIEAALAGRAAVLRRRIRPSDARAAPRSRPNMCRGPMPAGGVAGMVMLVKDVTEQRDQRARAEGERGAVPADRQFGAGDDVGDAARPRRATSSTTLMSNSSAGRAATARRRGRSTGATRIHPDDVERIVAESIAGEARGKPFTLEGRYRRAGRRVALAAERVAAALRRRTGSWSGSSASPPTSPSPRRPSSSFAARSRSGRASWR